MKFVHQQRHSWASSPLTQQLALYATGSLSAIPPRRHAAAAWRARGAARAPPRTRTCRHAGGALHLKLASSTIILTQVLASFYYSFMTT